MSDAMATLGNLIDTSAKRDAIHIAVAPVVAAEKLFAGQDVGFIKEGDTENVGAVKAIAFAGIVDPFLKSAVNPGQRFWMFLYPRTITSLRHEWTHPAFSGVSQEVAAAEVRLRAIAPTIDMEFDEMIQGAKRYVERDDYMIEGGRWEGYSLPDDFWDHFETFTGTKLGEDKYRGRFFSCSC